MSDPEEEEEDDEPRHVIVRVPSLEFRRQMLVREALSRRVPVNEGADGRFRSYMVRCVELRIGDRVFRHLVPEDMLSVTAELEARQAVLVSAEEYVRTYRPGPLLPN